MKPNLRILFTIALGVADRPNRFHTPAKFFLDIGTGLANYGVKSFYINHSAVHLKELEQKGSTKMDDHTFFDDHLDKVKPDYIFVWSGNFPGDRETARIAAEKGIPVIYGELGWFPQSETVYFDAEGTNYRSSIRKLDLDNVEVDGRLDAWAQEYLRSRMKGEVSEEGYLLVVLQDEQDLNIMHASPYKKMNEFVNDISHKFENEKIVVRKHPRFLNADLMCYPNVKYEDKGNVYDWMKNAKGIIGINSTVLLEALLLEKPVYAVGAGLASGLGVFHESSFVDNIILYDKPCEDIVLNSRKLLSELIFRRMLYRKDLADPLALRECCVFKSIMA